MIALVDPVNKPLYRSFEVDAPAEKVWTLLADLRSRSGWMLTDDIQTNHIGDGEGMIRTVHVPDSPPMVQKVDYLSDETMTVSVSFMNCEDFGLISSSNMMRVIALDDQRSKCFFTAQFEAMDPKDHDQLLEQTDEKLEMVVAMLRQILEEAN